jgi:hypothetical protein
VKFTAIVVHISMLLDLLFFKHVKIIHPSLI